MKRIICSFILFICCIVPLFSDFYYLFPLEFSIPDGWTAEEEGDLSSFTSPDGDFFIYVWQMKDFYEREKAIANIVAEIENIIADFSIKMEEELWINEMFVYIADGDGYFFESNAGVSVAVIEADTFMEVYYYIFLFTGTNKGWENNWQIVNETLESIYCEREGG